MQHSDQILFVLCGRLRLFPDAEFQEQDLLTRLSDLQQEATCRKNRVTDLDHEIHSLNETISTLTKELELKGKEVLRVRSEANLHIRSDY